MDQLSPPEIMNKIPALNSILLCLRLFQTVGIIITKLIARFVPKTIRVFAPKKSIKNIRIGPSGIPTNPAKYPEISKLNTKKIIFNVVRSFTNLTYQTSYLVHKFVHYLVSKMVLLQLHLKRCPSF